MMSFARVINRLHVSVPAVSPRLIGGFSYFSTSPSAALSEPSLVNQYQRFNPPPASLPANLPSKNPTTEKIIFKTALQDLKKEQEEINYLQSLIDQMKIALMPSSPTVDLASRHIFQVMNRNARKAKRANHGKRPCSRDRRRWKIKKWANTSRRG